jgi:hypothetical protein
MAFIKVNYNLEGSSLFEIFKIKFASTIQKKHPILKIQKTGRPAIAGNNVYLCVSMVYLR